MTISFHFQTLNIPQVKFLARYSPIALVKTHPGVPVLTENFAGAAGTISPASPFSLHPCTTARNAITNFNVLVSGADSIQPHRIPSSNSRTSWKKVSTAWQFSRYGLISSHRTTLNGYRFIVVDLSPPSEATDNVSQINQVIGTNTGDKPIEYLLVSCVWERSRWTYKTGSLDPLMGTWEITPRNDLLGSIHTIQCQKPILSFPYLQPRRIKWLPGGCPASASLQLQAGTSGLVDIEWLQKATSS
jgi:hypothetical protein